MTTKSPSPVATRVSWPSTRPVTPSTNPSKPVSHPAHTATSSQETLATAAALVNVSQLTAVDTPTSTSHNQLIQWWPFTLTHHATATVVTAEEAHQEVDHHLEVDHHQGAVPHQEALELNAVHVTAAQPKPTAVTWESTSFNAKERDACGVHPTNLEIHGVLKSSQAVVMAVEPMAHQAAKSATPQNKTVATSESINPVVKAKDVVGLNPTLVVLHGASTQLKLTFFFLLFCCFSFH